MKLLGYAVSELERIPMDEDGMQAAINHDILEIVKLFANQDHSGFSAEYAVSVLERLLRLKPLTPLTGEDDEWMCTEFGDYQNKRCSSVFKEANGTCCDIDAVLVSDNGGITWCRSSRFRKIITFPYTVPIQPERVYIEYPDIPAGHTGELYEVITDKPERIKALYEHKKKLYKK